MVGKLQGAGQRLSEAGRERLGGFSYLGLLLVIALLGVGLTAASEVWVTSAQRERLTALEWTGAQYVQAIASYYHSSPGSEKAYPLALNDLLEDQRYLTIRRHLRTLYPNPFTNLPDWEPVRAADGSVRGVRATLPKDVAGGFKLFTYAPESQGK